MIGELFQLGLLGSDAFNHFNEPSILVCMLLYFSNNGLIVFTFHYVLWL